MLGCLLVNRYKQCPDHYTRGSLLLKRATLIINYQKNNLFVRVKWLFYYRSSFRLECLLLFSVYDDIWRKATVIGDKPRSSTEITETCELSRTIVQLRARTSELPRGISYKIVSNGSSK